MKQFILNMWAMGKINKSQVLSYAPKFITAHQAEEIIATPRNR